MVYDYDAGLQGFNLFIYCGNNPKNRIDVSGMDSEDDDGAFDSTPEEEALLLGSGGKGKSGGGGNGSGSSVAESSGYTPPPGGGGNTNSIQVENTTVTFGHGGRHLQGSGVDSSTVENAIAHDVVKANPTQNVYYPGSISVNGFNLKYSAYRLSPTHINIGTYYILAQARPYRIVNQGGIK